MVGKKTAFCAGSLAVYAYDTGNEGQLPGREKAKIFCEMEFRQAKIGVGGAGGGSNDQREENIEIQKLSARKEGRKCPTPCPPKKKASVKEQGSV